MDISARVRSKNAGPYVVTIDVFCVDDEQFQAVESGVRQGLTEIAAMYGVDESDVCFYAVPSIHAVKVTLPRRSPAGSPDDDDIYGAQLHAPLMRLELS
jgi:hypothetical protein